RSAVLVYCSENSVEVDASTPTSEAAGGAKPLADKKKVNTPNEGVPSEKPGMQTRENLGETLISLKKLDGISFPFGEKIAAPFQTDDQDPWQPDQPQIRAVSLLSLSKQFGRANLFSSARSDRVAVLVVPFLTAKEAEALQKMMGNIQKMDAVGHSYPSDCFFIRSSRAEKFNGWLYLCDL
ncbi:MAG: hypothetical protein EBZ78_10175, partial [Verrucomicrobia bacterium]|nr:hypothetical protein [Verrucomicrobiota bacterium]